MTTGHWKPSYQPINYVSNKEQELLATKPYMYQ